MNTNHASNKENQQINKKEQVDQNSRTIKKPNESPEQIIANEHKKSKKFDIQRPGHLTNEVQLFLNTVDAQSIFDGLHNPKGIGLLKFGGRMTQIWNAAAQDDPYADFYLLKVYDAIIKLRQKMGALIEEYQQQLNKNNNNPNINIQPSVSTKPLAKPLWFRSQYGYLGAYLIADFDHLMQIILTANRIGVILPQSHKTLRDELTKQILAIFRLPFEWEATGLIREDFKTKNKATDTTNDELDNKIKAAIEKMGALPESVLNKTLRSPFVPEIIKK